jgi:hypothetical protein
MSISFPTDSHRAKVSRALYEDASCEIDTVTRTALETKIARSTSTYLRISESKSITSLAEQDPYYMARATALHGSCLCCGTKLGPASL